MSKIFAIYPTDKKHSINFLNKINTYLTRRLNKDWHCYKIKFNNECHENCINTAINSAKFIFFMGHGRNDCLYGSCAKENLNNSNKIQGVEQYYRNEQFIDKNNIGKFNNKIFFSLSCNSNEDKTNSLSRKARENGVLCFIGFGDIQTDYIKGVNFPKKAIEVFKGLITKIIKESLYISIVKNYTVDRLIDLIKILTNKEMQNLLLHKKNRHKKIILKNLFDFKNEIKIFGNRFEPIV